MYFSSNREPSMYILLKIFLAGKSVELAKVFSCLCVFAERLIVSSKGVRYLSLGLLGMN